jgi:hypothetical protein
MLTTQVALVPLEPQDDAFNSQLTVVASSLQTQVTRDFGPVWGVSAVVSAFLNLEDVPPQYFPVILTTEDLPGDHHGFHIATDGRPFALVHLDDTWSLSASHELLEMVLDPNGDLTVSGPSIADEAVKTTPIEDYVEQGTVDYLVEPCDPVESSTYEINGVTVSDFVTPSFYDEYSAAGRQYSFLGSVTEPFQMLAAGYLSWRSRIPLNSVWQAFGPSANDDDGSAQGAAAPASQSLDPKTPVTAGQLKIRRLSDVEPPRARTNGTSPADDFVPRVSRAQVDQVKRRSNPAANGTPVPDPKWAAYATSFESDVRQVIKLLKTTPPTLQDLIGLFTEAQTNGSSPDAALFAKYHVDATPEVLAAFNDSERRKNLPVILKLLQKQEEISSLLGAGASDPDLGSWYCRLMP